MPDVDKNNDGHLDVIVEDTKLELESNDRDDKTKLNDENDRVKTNGKVKNVNDDDNALEKVKKKITPTLKSSSVFFYGILSSMLLIGCITINKCPINTMIPIYLIIAGLSGIFTNILIKTSNKHWFNLLLILIAFDFVWHGLGSYWVYVEYQPNYDSQMGLYCNRLAYLLAFWMLTIQSTLLILMLLLISCYLLMNNDFRN